ncbi:replicative DNA helicase [Granulicatella adiacens ATCC 49175]|jgi:replicative DNA helicase|uniref:Replicative DNA helicase n=1 Tax=Granulicatella adiacens ATCC 49175 TaxID=638301 RepID=C8NI05_9LACT|nr:MULTISPECIES: replicative DNA helicase [Granulicatella]EEW36818.1 replicative DNA helicase [Granulicatella adiacens ATCC 49175]OFT01714.1 replicative DNA helicase [Granulicatella sp. HMSC31F03]UAK94586.1 replicative DNA helicase [Granulicatella adiacens]UWP38170.1 replicative DNA helicase [Granulicatella adiacens ATCC 49175]
MEELYPNLVPPQNLEAEEAVLGSILLEQDSIISVMEFLVPDDFYRVAHQLIFAAMIELNQNSEAIDPITVSEKLRQKNQIDNVGGEAGIIELLDKVPTAANVEFYTQIVLEKSTRRKLIKTSTNIVKNAYQEDETIANVLDTAERDILSVSEGRNKAGFIPIRDVLHDAYESLEERSKNNGEVTGIATGYIGLDRMTSGLHADELIILAARPSVGKTAFVLNIAKNVAVNLNETVAIFSLEMGAESLVERIICSHASINAGHLKTGKLTDEEYTQYFVATGVLAEAPIYIDDTPGIRVSEIRAKCRRLKQERNNLGLVVIDYLQLIEGNGKESRQQEVSEISRNLKKLAKELKVPVIALSQLSRGVEQRQDKRPIMSDIRESGSIEQDADIVAFLYRDDYYRQEPDENGHVPEVEPNSTIEVIIEKNRSGPRGTVELNFMKEFNKFTNLVPDEIEQRAPMA